MEKPEKPETPFDKVDKVRQDATLLMDKLDKFVTSLLALADEAGEIRELAIELSLDADKLEEEVWGE